MLRFFACCSKKAKISPQNDEKLNDNPIFDKESERLWQCDRSYARIGNKVDEIKAPNEVYNSLFRSTFTQTDDSNQIYKSPSRDKHSPKHEETRPEKHAFKTLHEQFKPIKHSSLTHQGSFISHGPGQGAMLTQYNSGHHHNNHSEWNIQSDNTANHGHNTHSSHHDFGSHSHHGF